MNYDVLLGVLLLTAVALYVAKRFFDDKSSARRDQVLLSSEILVQLDELTKRLASQGTLLESSHSFLRERLGVYEKALLNAINQFKDIAVDVESHRQRALAAVVSNGIRPGMRKPAP